MKETIAKKGIAKRLFSAFLALALLVTLLPTATMAVEAGTSDTADVTWTLDDITSNFSVNTGNTRTIKDIELSGSGTNISKMRAGYFYIDVGYNDCYLEFHNTQNRKIKKVIAYLYTGNTSRITTDGWSLQKSGSEDVCVWEGTEPADSVRLGVRSKQHLVCYKIRILSGGYKRNTNSIRFDT